MGVSTVSMPLILQQDHNKIGALMDELIDLRCTPKAFRLRMLKGLAALIDANSTSSIIRATGFFSERGKYVDHDHVNSPQVTIKIISGWMKVFRRFPNLVENALYKASQGRPVGIETIGDLLVKGYLNAEVWERSYLYKLKNWAGIGDMVYLWIRCVRDDLWVVCLRRKSDAPAFSPYECELLTEFGYVFNGLRPRWYLKGLEELTLREQEVVRELDRRKPRRLIAESLNISPKTLDRHFENICNKLTVSNYWEIIPKLEERTRSNL